MAQRGKPETVDPTAGWTDEAHDVTPWLLQDAVVAALRGPAEPPRAPVPSAAPVDD